MARNQHLGHDHLVGFKDHMFRHLGRHINGPGRQAQAKAHLAYRQQHGCNQQSGGEVLQNRLENLMWNEKVMNL